MDSPVEEIAFLARSRNRVALLDLLSRDAYGRRALRDELGVSQATVNRIVRDFEARGWVAVEDSRYRATPPGAVVGAAFGSLVGTVESMRALVAISRCLPADVDLDPTALVDAEFTLPKRGDVLAPVRRTETLMRRSARVRLLSPFFTPETLRANRDAVVEDGQSLELVVTTAVLDCVTATPSAAAHLAEIVAGGGAVYRYDGAVSCGLAECDGRYALGFADEHGAPLALVETADEGVGQWVLERIDAHRDAATRVGPSRQQSARPR